MPKARDPQSALSKPQNSLTAKIPRSEGSRLVPRHVSASPMDPSGIGLHSYGQSVSVFPPKPRGQAQTLEPQRSPRTLEPGGTERTDTSSLDQNEHGPRIRVQPPVPMVQAMGELPDSGATELASQGLSGSAQSFPHLSAIQRSFGRHSLGDIRAHTGPEAIRATRALGAHAYAAGSDVAFSSPPSLFTAAHEAAHVVQQRSGLQLPGGIGAAGDAHEQHASEVARWVSAGLSAEKLLDQYGCPASPDSPGGPSAVQLLRVNLTQEDQDLTDKSSTLQSWRARNLRYDATFKTTYYDTKDLSLSAKRELLSLINDGEYRLKNGETLALRFQLCNELGISPDESEHGHNQYDAQSTPDNQHVLNEQTDQIEQDAIDELSEIYDETDLTGLDDDFEPSDQQLNPQIYLSVSQNEINDAKRQKLLQPLNANTWEALEKHATQAKDPFAKIVKSLIAVTRAIDDTYEKIHIEEEKNPYYQRKSKYLPEYMQIPITPINRAKSFDKDGNYIPNHIPQQIPPHNRRMLSVRKQEKRKYSSAGKLKGKIRATKKATVDYKNSGGFRRVLDVVRGTLTFADLSGLYFAMRAILNHEASLGYLVVKCKQTYEDPSSTLYGDVKLLLRERASGHICELQLTTKGMFDAKLKGHKPYEDIRDATPEDETVSDLHKLENKTRYGIVKRAIADSRHIYGEARKEAERDLYYWKVINFANDIGAKLSGIFEQKNKKQSAFTMKK